MNEMEQHNIKRASYGLFILLLTFLSFFNLVAMIFFQNDDIRRVALMVNILLSLIFLIDFFLRLHFADVRKDYFFKQYGWLDLIGSIPIPGFNLARIWSSYLTLRKLDREGSKAIISQVAARRAESAMLFIGLTVIYILEFGSIFILKAESRSFNANIRTADDALWWVFVTISTVGYGDRYPVTNLGRSLAVFIIIAGVGVFGVLSGYLANSFLGQRKGYQAAGGNPTQEPLLQELKAMQQAQKAAQAAQEKANADLLARIAGLEDMLQKGEEL